MEIGDKNLNYSIPPIFMKYVNYLDKLGSATINKVVSGDRGYDDVA
jgi:hypothetical protein